MALEKRDGEISYGVWKKVSSQRDRELNPITFDGDWTFVTSMP